MESVCWTIRGVSAAGNTRLLTTDVSWRRHIDSLWRAHPSKPSTPLECSRTRKKQMPIAPSWST